MHFDWWTLLLQIVNFLILVWLLWHFLYKPVREVIARRRKLAEAALADASRKQKEAEAEKTKLEAARTKLDGERQALLEAARREAEQKRQERLDAAEKEAGALLAEAREATAKAREADISSLRQEITGAAVAIARKILQETVGGSLDPLFRQRILNKLDALGDDRKQGADGGLRITTAAELPEPEKVAWSEALATRFPGTVSISFAVDPSFVAGAEIELPNGVLRSTWADALNEARSLLTGPKSPNPRPSP